MDSIIENYKDSTSSANSLELVLVIKRFFNLANRS